METIVLTLIFIFCVIFPLWKWYRPKIEIIQLIKGYSVYIVYNKWDGPDYKGRVAKHLFDI